MKKNLNPIAASVAVVVLAIICLTTLLWRAHDIKMESKEVRGENNLPISVVTVQENTKLYSIYFEYPVFPPKYKNVNDEVSKEVESAVSDFKSSVKENWDARRATASRGEIVPEYPDAPFALSGSWEPAQLSTETVSFLLRYSGFTGGAHGFEVVRAWNYNLGSNKTILITDVFANYPDFPAGVAENIIDQIRDSTETPESWISEAITPEKLNTFSNFTFNNDRVIFHFNQYEVGPYSIGLPEAVIYR